MTTLSTPLTREVIVAAAIDVADAGGIDAVSRPAVAAALGVATKMIEERVADREDLIAAMIDTIVAKYPFPPDAHSWVHAVRFRILAARREFHLHPWLQPAIQTATHRTPAVLGHIDALAGDLVAAGISYAAARQALHILGYRIWGFHPEPFQTDTAATPTPPVDAIARDYPHAAAITADPAMPRHAATAEADVDFAVTLDLLLDAIGRIPPRQHPPH